MKFGKVRHEEFNLIASVNFMKCFLTGFYLTELYFKIRNLYRTTFLCFLASMPAKNFPLKIYANTG